MSQEELLPKTGGRNGEDVFLTEKELMARLVLSPLNAVLEFHSFTSSTYATD
jgi:hypothetical protein